MTRLAIITARGGSKRIPMKNIKDFCGKPILVYSIEAALESAIFDEVMVSTDSHDIANIATKYGAQVPFLRSELTSNDFATTSDVISEVLEKYEQRGKNFDLICCIYPTAPFITGEKLSKAMRILEDSDAYSLIPVVRFSYPPQRAVIIRGDRVLYQYPEYERVRSQDLEALYHDCGQFYICRSDAFKQYRSLITPKSIPFEIAEEEVQDIDTLSDWKFAEIKYNMFIKKEK